jgi:hypothetical protein
MLFNIAHHGLIDLDAAVQEENSRDWKVVNIGQLFPDVQRNFPLLGRASRVAV